MLKQNNNIKKSSLRQLLIKWFLLLTLLPLIIISLLSYLQSRDSLINSATNELVISAYETKRLIDNWFNDRMMDITHQAEKLSTAQNLEKLTQSYHKSPKTLSEFVKSYSWVKQVDTISSELLKMRRNYGYIHDIFLIDSSANILLNLTQEDDLGTNLQSGKYRKTDFAKAVLSSLNTGETVLSRKSVV